MDYKEELFLRKRVFTLEEHGIDIIDQGIFRTTRNYIKYGDISSSTRFKKENINDKILSITLILTLSIIIILKSDLDIFLMISAIILIVSSAYWIIYLIKYSSYKGTLFLNDKKSTADDKLHLKTNYPMSEQTNQFIKAIRKHKLNYHLNQIINPDVENGFYFQSQRQLNSQLAKLKYSILLSDNEFNAMKEILADYYKNNDIPEIYSRNE